LFESEKYKEQINTVLKHSKGKGHMAFFNKDKFVTNGQICDEMFSSHNGRSAKCLDHYFDSELNSIET